MYLGKSLAEIADMQQNEKSESANWKRQELQAQIDLMNDIMQIADSAERGISDKGKISPQIQRGRTIARAQEHMSMIDLLTAEQRRTLMNAEYTTSLLYPGNPYVEALPPMLAGQELIRALASVPLYSTSDRDRSTGERLQLLSALYEFYQPLTMTLDLYCEVYNAMQHCYGQYTPQRGSLSNRATPPCRARLLPHPSAAATLFRCRCVRAGQVNGIAACFVFVSPNYPPRTLQWANALLPANPYLVVQTRTTARSRQ